MAIVLRITHDGGHKFLDITKALKPIVFGRSDDCDYTIKDDGCSGTHLQIALKDSYISVKDLESKNGTVLNNKRITLDRLYVDDIIQIGEAFIELHSESLTTVEKETFKNKRRVVDQKAGDLTIPDMSKSHKSKEKLVDDNKRRHGFNELTNITGIAAEKVSKLLSKVRKKKD